MGASGGRSKELRWMDSDSDDDLSDEELPEASPTPFRDALLRPSPSASPTLVDDDGLQPQVRLATSRLQIRNAAEGCSRPRRDPPPAGRRRRGKRPQPQLVHGLPYRQRDDRRPLPPRSRGRRVDAVSFPGHDRRRRLDPNVATRCILADDTTICDDCLPELGLSSAAAVDCEERPRHS
uniref:Uncharacterized protein n=1 Tax=Setaria italica TaxID=4555 RepID=K3ZGI5_SETIT